MTNPTRYKLSNHIVLRIREVFDTKNQLVRGLEPTAAVILQHIETHPKSVKEIQATTGYPSDDIAEFLETAVSYSVVEIDDKNEQT